MEGKWVEKTLFVQRRVDRSFQGTIYITVMPDESLKFSWLSKGDDMKPLSCGGYVFKALRPVAEENYRKLIAKGMAPSENFWCSHAVYFDLKTKAVIDARKTR